MSLEAVAPSDPPLAEWLTPALTVKAGRDPLGLQTITLDRIIPELLPGVLALSQRARYLSIYPFLLYAYRERRLATDNASLGDFIRRREYELCLAAQLCPRDCGALKAIGNDRAGPDARAQPASFKRRLSVESPMGGYGLYYRSPLIDLGLVVPAGAMLGDSATPIDLLAVDGRAEVLARCFEEAISETTYARDYMNGVDPIPIDVIRELSERACLCRLDDFPAEQQAIRAAYFEEPGDDRSTQVEQRRRAFAVFLDQLTKDSESAHSEGAFRRGLIRAFTMEPGGSEARADTRASWGALAMKECVQEALCSLWTEFCRRGLDHQKVEGMSPSELRDFIAEELAGAGELSFENSSITWTADQPVEELRGTVNAVFADLDWEDVAAWAAEKNTAMAGLIALLWFADQTPERDSAPAAWQWVAEQNSDHQLGLLQTVLALRSRVNTGPTVGETLDWALRTFILGPHEVIAYSKLPDSTFRFCWEEGRLRFYPTGHERFRSSIARRAALSSLSRDLGLWESAGEKAQLTPDGRALVAEVFG